MFKLNIFSRSPWTYVTVIIIGIIMVFFITKDDINSNNKYNSLTEPTQATITKYNINKMRGKRTSYTYYHSVTFEYVVNDTKYIVSSKYRGPKNEIGSVGSKIAIHYDKNNPKSSAPDEFMEFNKKYNNSLIRNYCILIVIAIIGAIYTFSRYKNIKKLEY